MLKHSLPLKCTVSRFRAEELIRENLKIDQTALHLVWVPDLCACVIQLHNLLLET